MPSSGQLRKIRDGTNTCAKCLLTSTVRPIASCTNCSRLYHRLKEQERRIANRDEINQKLREYRATPAGNKKRKESYRRWADKNQDRIKFLNNEYNAKNREKRRLAQLVHGAKLRYGEFWEAARVLMEVKKKLLTEETLSDDKDVRTRQLRRKRYYEKKYKTVIPSIEANSMGHPEFN